MFTILPLSKKYDPKYIKPSTKDRPKGLYSMMQVKELCNHRTQHTSQSSLIDKLNLQHIMEINPRSPIFLIKQGCQFVAIDLLFLDTAIDGNFIPSLTQTQRSVGIAYREMRFRESGFRCRRPCWRGCSLWWRWSPPTWYSW